jgi:hypothetical protein
MKTKEEIEQLGKQSAQKKYRLQHIPLEQIDEYGGEIKDYVTIFIQGYTQCQEDMVDKIEIKWNEYRTVTNNEDAWLFKQWLISSLNKQDNEK